MPEQANHSEAARLRDIISISRLVVSSLDLDEVLEKILLYARELVAVPAGSIALYDGASGYMSLHAATGLSAAFTARDRWRVREGGLTRRILDQEELYIVEDCAQESCINNPLALAEGIRSLIAVPLRVQQEIVGILYLNDFTPRRFDQAGCEQLGILCSFAALSIDNARLHENALRLAATDGLTGLFNHRQFKRVLAQEANRAQRYGAQLSLVMFDIDNFKLFNDRYGHPCGDQVLIGVARVLGEIFREADLLFRYGGEEFVAVLPHADPDAALVVAERARAAIAALRTRCSSSVEELGVTVSVGVASLPQQAASGEELLQVADQLMYRAKHQGKNRVHSLQSLELA